MYKKDIYAVLLLLLLLFLVINKTTAETTANTYDVEGYLHEINFKKNTLTINEKKYLISEDICITRNGQHASLRSCLPLDDNYQWAKIKLDETGSVLLMDVFYQVVEGEVCSVSEKGYIYVQVFRQKPSDAREPEKYYVEELVENDLIPGSHIVMITANKTVLKIIQ
ncbi:MAG: hypothetical protein ACOCRZ_00200 [Halothermotrichaceae bacterium]